MKKNDVTVKVYARIGWRRKMFGKFTMVRGLSKEETLSGLAWGLREAADYLELKALLDGLAGEKDAVPPTSA